MTYATDGKCHNANRGTYGHECGKPATWIGTKRDGFRSGFCDRCKADGDEARHYHDWQPVAWIEPVTEPTPQGNQYVMPGCERDKSRGPAQMDLW